MSKSRSFKTTAQYQHSQPQWLNDIITNLGTDITAWSINCYHPNTVIRNVGKLSKVVGNLKIMIFLEPWSTGNYLEINQQAFSNWTAGTILAFPESSNVIDINLGDVPRYTVELSGCL